MTGTLSVKADYREYTEIYMDYYPLIFNTVYSKINNYDDAEDICQEIFIRFYNKFKDVENARKWLYGTMKNVIFEFFRKKGKSEDDIDSVLEDAGLSFINGFKDIRVIIQEALNNVNIFNNEKEKIAFELISIYNYSYTKTAKTLGLSLHKVRYKYKKSVETLLSHLKSKGIDNLEDLL